MGRAGRAMARPWLDRTILSALRHIVFPLSRAWAEAECAGQDCDRFVAGLGLTSARLNGKRVERALRKRADAAVRSSQCALRWNAALFDGPDPGADARLAIETERLEAANALNSTRRHFAFLLPHRIAAVRLAVETPSEIDARFGSPVDRRRLLHIPDPLPAPQQSRSVETQSSVDTWLRFPSPTAGDIAYARVHTPRGVTDPPTVIMGHGICIAYDHWHGIIDETQALVAQGLRVIRPEAPWHGRRAPQGYYSGERAIGHFPSGQLEIYAHALPEWATLARWARSTSSRAVAFGGMSLGALTAQLASTLADRWPADCRPDALYLITHSDRMSRAITEGALSTMWADPSHAEAKGWTTDTARIVLDALEVLAPPNVAPDRIVSVLGRRDVITPYASGVDLVRRWHLPSSNRFEFENGHFTVPMRLAANGEATARFGDVLRAI